MAYSGCLQSCTPKFPSLPLRYHVHPLLAMYCSWAWGARVLQALGTLLQAGGIWGHKCRQCPRKDMETMWELVLGTR